MAAHQSDWARSMTFREQMTVLRRLLPYAKLFWPQFLGGIGFAAIVSVINVLLPRFLQYYMDHFLQGQSTPLRIMFLFGAVYFLGTVIKAIFQFFQAFLYSMGAERTLEKIRVLLFNKLHTLGMRYFDQTPAGSIVSRVTNDTMALADFWTLFLTLFVGLFSVITAFIAMLTANAKIAIWTLLFLPVLMLIIWYYQRYSSKVYRLMRQRLSELNNQLNESIVGIDVIQQFRQEHRVANDFESTNRAYLNTRFAMIRTNSLLLQPVISLLYALAVVAILAAFGTQALSSYVAAGLVYAFLQYVDNFFNPMTNMMDYLSTFTDGIVAGSRVLRILDDQTLNPQQQVDPTAKITRGKIEFRDVSFAYDGEHPVLKHVSFVAEPGQTVALVGHTGSGKSSTINVLMRFYEFQSGQVLVDDRDIREYSMAELRQKLGLVLQDSFLFYGDISSNIRMYNDQISDDQVQKAAEFVQADQFIQQLPNQYHAKVIEKGAAYSSGQRQLISFARTMVTEPKILILDEATANIDTETEQQIQSSLTKMRSGRTTVAIAHRLSTIKDADLILVLDQGEVVERGTHQELLAKQGRYYDLYRLQSTANLQ